MHVSGSTEATAAVDPAELDLIGAATQLRERRLSSLELTDACLRRIEQRNGGPPSHDGSPDAINAWVRLYPELAREQALAADQRRQLEGVGAPLLCGIPIAVKDLFGVAGLPLTASSRVLEGNVARVDAPAWERLRAQGMVLLGHTHTHEFAAGGTTDQVGNPWALGRVVGGSSGGNAAALAARMAPAALGSDTCGSLRIPSACCGTSAIKPSHGRIPIDGIIPLAPSLDHPGPMARTVADCAALLGALTTGAPPTDPLSPPAAPLAKLALAPRADARPLAGLRVALTDRPDALELAPAVARGLDAAVRACKLLGADVVALPAPWEFAWDDLGLVLLTEVWAYHGQFASLRERYRPAIAEFVETASQFTDAQAYLGAQARRRQGTASWEAWFAEHRVDLVLEPTVPIVPHARGRGYDSGHTGGAGDPMIALTALWDLTGMPVAALPVSWEVGVSLVAPRGREGPLLQAAIDLQMHALGTP